jgi:hypothetical protein
LMALAAVGTDSNRASVFVSLGERRALAPKPRPGKAHAGRF